MRLSGGGGISWQLSYAQQFRLLVILIMSGKYLWLALRQGGYRGWQRLRYKYQQCAELAFKKMQHRRFPDDSAVYEEMLRLQKLVHGLEFE